MSECHKSPILFIGGTGYIGGSVLSRLFHHPEVDSSQITALVRSTEKAEKLRWFHFKTAVGSTGNLTQLEKLSEQAHVVFSCADADDLPGIQAILRGMKRRHDSLGDRPVLIHTSGTGVLATEAKGMFPSTIIYDDQDVEQIEGLPDNAPHRHVDLTIVQADQQGYVRGHIVLPGTIWGIASNPLVAAGIQNPYSQQIPSLIRASLDRKQAGMVGKGLAIWPDVNIEDVANLYMKLFDTIMTKQDTVGHGREGFYFGENGEHTWYSISKEIASVLFQEGISQSDEPTSFSKEELTQYWGSEDAGNSHGSNARCRANRSLSLGWKPTQSTSDMISSIRSEMETHLHH